MKNRLKFSRAYLVGPMDHARELGRGWRIELEKWLITELQVLTFDPYHKPLHPMHNMGLEDDDNYVLRKQAIQNLDRAEARKLTKPIVATDLRIVDNVDFVIVNLDIDNHPCGTLDESFTADNENKPVIVHCPQGVSAIYDWLWGRLRPELFFDTWGDVKTYLKHIAFDEEIDCMDRWKFFDLEDKILEIVHQDYVLVPRNQVFPTERK